MKALFSHIKECRNCIKQVIKREEHELETRKDEREKEKKKKRTTTTTKKTENMLSLHFY